MRLEVAPAEVPVIPGQPALVVAQVFNTDDVINAYEVRVFGVDPDWVRLDEPRLSLFPGALGTISVLINVPVDYPAGELRVGVEVTPVVDRTRRQVGESTLVVPPIRKATMSVDPVAIAAGRRASFSVTLGNEGNTPLSLSLAAIDPEAKVKVAFSPPTVEVAPKQQVIVPAKAVGKRPLIGNPAARTLTFSVSGSDHPIEGFASFVQKPVLGRGLVSLLGLMAAATIFALVLTSTLGRVVDVARVSDKLLERAVNGTEADRGIVPNPGAVAGTVTLRTTGSPQPGVTVELFAVDDPTAPVASAATAADGTFRLGGLRAGAFKLRYRGAGFAEIWFGGALAFEDAKEVEVALGETTGGLDIALGGIPGSIAGKVVGQDPADAVVTLQLPADTLGSPTDAQVASVTADGDGAFLLEKVPAPASYVLVVTKEGYATEKRVVNIAAAEEKTGVEVALRTGDGLISGLVTAGGEPLGGVAVTASNATNEASTITLTSGAVGTFNLRNLPTPGVYTLGFEKAGYATENVTITLGQGEQLSGVGVALSPGTGSIAGVVRRQGSGPVGGVTVSVGVGDETLKTETLSVGDVGSYLLTGLPIPGTYTVTFSGAGLATQVRSIDLDRDDPNLDDVDATMTAATARVVGTVKDSRGAAGGVTVVLTNGTDTWTTRTADDPAGSYVLRDVKPGTYTVTFSREGAEPRSVLVSLRAGEERTVDVTLARRAAVSGVVTRADTDEPLPGAAVRLYRADSFPGTVVAEVVTNADGEYSLDDIPVTEDPASKAWIVEFAYPADSVAQVSRSITLRAGEQRELDETLELASD